MFYKKAGSSHWTYRPQFVTPDQVQAPLYEGGDLLTAISASGNFIEGGYSDISFTINVMICQCS